MSLKTDLEEYTSKVLADQWTTRTGQIVPDTADIKLANDAVRLDATALYADLEDSTQLVQGYADSFAAEMYKIYLYGASRIITSLGGSVSAFDGDRVMGVFLGSAKNSNAAQCGLKINYVVRKIIGPAIEAQYPNGTYTLKQKVGIDSSPLLVARTGIRGSNDLVWVGRAANYAAKMATLSSDFATYISEEVYSKLNDDSKYGGTPQADMWRDLGTSAFGFRVYGSTYTWDV
jgi:class 3 adenylate cyclase